MLCRRGRSVCYVEEGAVFAVWREREGEVRVFSSTIYTDEVIVLRYAAQLHDRRRQAWIISAMAGPSTSSTAFACNQGHVSLYPIRERKMSVST